LSMFSSQGDLSASLSSLVSDGLGSTGLFQFNDQYSIAAIYTFFGILISASAIATVVALTEKKGDLLPHQFSVLHLAVFVLVGSFSITMPWVMNEMFRSGFSSAVAAMSLCAAMVAVIVSRSSFMVKAILLIAISVLSFAVYQVAAIYPLFALAVLAVPPLVKKLRSHPVQITLVILFVVGLAIRALPQVKDRMRSRLLLEGSITLPNRFTLDTVGPCRISLKPRSRENTNCRIYTLCDRRLYRWIPNCRSLPSRRRRPSWIRLLRRKVRLHWTLHSDSHDNCFHGGSALCGHFTKQVLDN
jgi:hypothetical protein